MATTMSSRPGYVSAILHFDEGFSAEARRDLLLQVAGKLRFKEPLEQALYLNPLDRDEHQDSLVLLHSHAVSAGWRLQHVFVAPHQFNEVALLLAKSRIAWLQRKGTERQVAELERDLWRGIRPAVTASDTNADVRQTPLRQQIKTSPIDMSTAQKTTPTRRGLPIIS